MQNIYRSIIPDGLSQADIKRQAFMLKIKAIEEKSNFQRKWRKKKYRINLYQRTVILQAKFENYQENL